MDLQAGVSVGQLLLSLGGILLASGVAWGGLLQRVRTLEKEIDTLSKAFPDLGNRLTRIEERTSYTANQIDKLTGSWLFKEPPAYAYEPRSIKSRD